MLDKGRIVMSGLNGAVRETHRFPLCPIAVDGIFVRAFCKRVGSAKRGFTKGELRITIKYFCEIERSNFEFS